MAVRIVKAKLDDGSEIAIEADETEADGIRAVGLGDQATTEINFRAALKVVRAAAAEMADTFRSLPIEPDGYEIAFGVKLGGSMGALIAKATGEANFTVKLTWKRGN